MTVTSVFTIVSPTAFRSRIEAYGKVMAWRSGEGGSSFSSRSPVLRNLPRRSLQPRKLREYLPRISVVVGCPVLVQTAENRLAVLPQGYHPENGGILVTGGGIPIEVNFDLAVLTLVALLDDIDFQTAGDRSRALSQLVTPGLKIGGFIRGFVPADVAEADQSQAGKTYRQRVVSAIYNETSRIVARRDGGVGSMDESFADALIAGRPFIQLDNLRGKLDSQYIETFLDRRSEDFPRGCHTAGRYSIDPTKYFVQVTSNGIETTRDMANRSCIIRIRKRHGHVFRRYAEGRDLLGYVRAHQPFYLGCVFAVIRRWVEHGKPRTDTCGHDFRDWAQSLDWIVQNFFRAAPLLDGHHGAQIRVSNPALTFLRNVAIHVKSAGRLGESLPASAISELCEEYGLTIPHLQVGKEGHAARQIGVLLGRLFRESDTAPVDEFSVTRTIRTTARADGGGCHGVKFYTFRENSAALFGAQAAQV